MASGFTSYWETHNRSSQVSGPAGTNRGSSRGNPDCTLSAKGYGASINVPLVALDYGFNIIATEDIGRDNRIFYPRQVQHDAFSISAIFATKADANRFNRWIGSYVDFVSSMASASPIAIGMRVQVPARYFDMTGFPVQGWSYNYAPVQLTDVTWTVTIAFEGAANTGAQILPPYPGYAGASYYGKPPAPDQSANQLMFYPSYYDPGSTQWTGDPSDALYRGQNKVPTPLGEIKQTITVNKLPPGTTAVFPTDKQYLKPIGPGLNPN